MLGNVWEWVQDVYTLNYLESYTGVPLVDLNGPATGPTTVSRGGA
jgi:formylglycine-generating enzyme required for sulfatase activity